MITRILAYIELNILSKAVKAKPIANIDFIFTYKKRNDNKKNYNLT